MDRMQEYLNAVERVGERNADILFERFERHEAGLLLMVQPMEGRKPHVVGPMKGTIEAPPTDEQYKAKFGSFLDRMKSIEEDFMSGKRKVSQHGG